MMASIPAYVTPEVIKWARESANLSVDEAAQKINRVSVDKLVKWEKGEAYPTLRQAEKMSKVYRRALAIFYLPEPPRDFQPIEDFRRNSDKKFGTALIFMIREVQEKQTWLSEFLKDEGEDPLPFIGKFSINDDPKKVANHILTTLSSFGMIRPQKNHLREWIDLIEKAGIFISRGSSIHSHLLIDLKDARGFAISDPYAPFVFLNTRDSETAQLFSLFHELAHLWISRSGVSNMNLGTIKK